MDRIRELFCFLDKLIYSLVKWILFGIFDLANLTTNSDIFSGVYSRIYVILGIFMAFKLSFSFFQYIIDPESMSGKDCRTIFNASACILSLKSAAATRSLSLSSTVVSLSPGPLCAKTTTGFFSVALPYPARSSSSDGRSGFSQ